MRKNNGFTLLELLMVIAIIGILASVILASLNSARDKGRIANAQSEIGTIRSALALLRTDTGLYPNAASTFCRIDPGANNEVDLNDPDMGLVGNDAGTFSQWDGPYIVEAVDPWGNSYYLDEDYQCLAATVGCQGITDVNSDSGSSVIVSCGPNGELDTGACAYDADNIVYYLCDT